MVVLIAAASPFGVLPAPARAQQAITVQVADVTNDFPKGLSFSLQAAVPAGLQEARLHYNIAPDGSDAATVADCQGDNQVTCSAQVGATRSSLLIPGSQVTWSWEVRDRAGDSQRSDQQVTTYQDDRFQWQTLSDGNLTVWYHGDEASAQVVLEAGRKGLDDMTALLKTQLPFPVKVFLYDTAEEMQPAIIGSDSSGVVTLGEVIYSDTAMVSSDYSPTEIARHELTHVVIRAATKGPFGIPDWLNEGTAVFSQQQPLADERSALDDAIAANRIFSVRSLSSSTVGARGSNVNLFYGESWSLVKFLVDNYGPDKFAELFATFKDGSLAGDALKKVYGFDEDGLENAWRASVGLPPRDSSTSGSRVTPVVIGDGGQQAVPVSNGQTSGSGSSFPVVPVAIVGGLTVVVLALIAGAGVLVSRRGR